MARALIVGFCGLPGPHRAGVQLWQVLRGLMSRHRVDALVLRRGEQAYVERFGESRILRVPVPGGDVRGRVEAFRRALRRQLEGADYDIVHFRDGWSGIPVLEMQSALSYATVFDAGRSPLTGPLPIDISVIAELERDENHCMQRADMVLAPTETARRYIAALRQPESVHLVGPGVDVDQFDWEDPPQTGPPTILFVGTLSPGRGVRVLLRAMLELLPHTDANLVIAGRSSRDFRTNLSSAIREVGLADRVELLGAVEHPQVPALIARATLCVAPGAPELTGNRMALYPTKMLEYMACQRAVVAPRRGSVTALIRDGQDAVLFEPGAPTDLAEKILKLLEDSDLRGRIARSGYELVRRSCTASGTRRELRRAYDWLASVPHWDEQFRSAEQRLADEDNLRLPTEADTASSDWPGQKKRGPHQPIAAFDSSELRFEETGEGAYDGSFPDPGEVTRVEAVVMPMAAAEETNSTSPIEMEVDNTDDWLVEDSRARSVSLSGEVTVGSTPIDEARSTPVTSMVSDFVSGEVEVSDSSELSNSDLDHIITSERLMPMAPLQGAPKDDEQTKLFEMPDAPNAEQLDALLDEVASEDSTSPGLGDVTAIEDLDDVPTGVDEADKTRVALRPPGPGDNARPVAESGPRQKPPSVQVDTQILPAPTVRPRQARPSGSSPPPTPKGARSARLPAPTRPPKTPPTLPPRVSQLSPAPGSVRSPAPGSLRSPAPGSVRSPAPGSMRPPAPAQGRPPPGSVRSPAPGTLRQPGRGTARPAPPRPPSADGPPGSNPPAVRPPPTPAPGSVRSGVISPRSPKESHSGTFGDGKDPKSS